MERLKRLRAAQLNKTFQKEVMTAAQRKLQEEKDRAARESLQRAAWRRSPSPPSPRCLTAPPLSAGSPLVWAVLSHMLCSCVACLSGDSLEVPTRGLCCCASYTTILPSL